MSKESESIERAREFCEKNDSALNYAANAFVRKPSETKFIYELFNDFAASETARLTARVQELERENTSLKSAGHSRVLNEWPNSDGGTCPLCGHGCSRSVYSDWVEIECNDCTFNCLEDDFKAEIDNGRASE